MTRLNVLIAACFTASLVTPSSASAIVARWNTGPSTFTIAAEGEVDIEGDVDEACGVARELAIDDALEQINENLGAAQYAYVSTTLADVVAEDALGQWTPTLIPLPAEELQQYVDGAVPRGSIAFARRRTDFCKFMVLVDVIYFD